MKVFPLPGSYLGGITVGPQPRMWFASFGDFTGEIGKITTR
jgi:hypothetical protein